MGVREWAKTMGMKEPPRIDLDGRRSWSGLLDKSLRVEDFTKVGF